MSGKECGSKSYQVALMWSVGMMSCCSWLALTDQVGVRSSMEGM